MSEFKGIDVSNARGVIDWPTAAASGLDFAIIKAGYGNEPNQIDSMYETNIKGAIAVGLPVGIYWFSYARNVDEAKIEARMAVEAAKPYKLSHPIYFDFEEDSERYCNENGITLPKGVLDEWAKAFCSEVRAAGCEAGIYASMNFLENHYSQEYLATENVWVAQYNNTLTYTGKRVMWQHSKENVSGVPGLCDCNICYVDFPSIIGQSVLTVPASAPSLPETHDEHIDVIYRVKTKKSGWLSEVKNMDDNPSNLSGYAGYLDSQIIDIAIKVSAGSVKYRVHTTDGRWHDYVTGYDINDLQNGYAGNDTEIDAVEVYFLTPSDIRPYKRAKYRVAPCGGGYYSWQYDDQTGNNPDGVKQDGYAGILGQPVGRFQIEIV